MRIFATADTHLGMKFSTYDEVGAELSQARFASLERCVELANAESCELFVIAGDLFDRQNVSGADIDKAVHILAGFTGSALLILPGNHDFYTGVDGRPWGPFIEKMRATSIPLVLLNENRCYDLDHFDLPVFVFPGPCAAKHSAVNMISWIGDIDQSAMENRLRIGVAHGSVEGLSPDLGGDYYPMMRKQLEQVPVDFWIIGHTHKPFPDEGTVQPRLFIPGTPEPDGFDCAHPGGAWILECSETGLESYRRIGTGAYRFYDQHIAVEEASAITTAVSAERAERSLISLAVTGTLDRVEYEKLPGVLEEMKSRFFYFKPKLDNLEEIVSTETVDDEFPPDSFPNKLIRAFIEEGDTEAAQTAYGLLREIDT